MPEARLRWLAAVAAAVMLAAPPVALAEAAARGPAPVAADDGRGQVSRQLVEIGRSRDEARAAAGRLTAADLEVLLANPEMMQAAGGVGTEMALGTILLLGVIVALAAAGSAVVIISL